MPGRFPHHRLKKDTASQRSRHASRHVRHACTVMDVGIANPQWRGNVPGIPGACATRNFTYLVRGPYWDVTWASLRLKSTATRALVDQVVLPEKKISKLRIIGHIARGIHWSPLGFPQNTEWANNAVRVSMWSPIHVFPCDTHLPWYSWASRFWLHAEYEMDT